MMNKHELLDEILLMIRTLTDDPVRLEKLHQFIEDELYEEPEKIKIPEKYQPLVKDTAHSLSAGLICYINPKTLEKTEFPESVVADMKFDYEESEDPGEADEYEDTSLFWDDFKRMQKEWENIITLEPPKSHISFTYMEDFVESLATGRLKNILADALSGRKPFSHFNGIIHQSSVREEWFAFRQKCLELLVAEELDGNLPDFNL